MFSRLLSIACASSVAACTLIAGVSSMEIVDDRGEDGSADQEGGRPAPSTGTGAQPNPKPPASPADASPPASSDPTRPLNATFDTSCAGWSATNGTLAWESVGRGAPGACRLCATERGDMTATASATATRDGYAKLELWMRKAAGKTTSTAVSVTVAGLTVLVPGTLQADWTRYGNNSAPSVSPEDTLSATIQVERAEPGDCVDFDDVTVALIE